MGCWIWYLGSIQIDKSCKCYGLLVWILFIAGVEDTLGTSLGL